MYIKHIYIYTLIHISLSMCIKLLAKTSIKLTFWFTETYNCRGMDCHIRDLDTGKMAKCLYNFGIYSTSPATGFIRSSSLLQKISLQTKNGNRKTLRKNYGITWPSELPWLITVSCCLEGLWDLQCWRHSKLD